MSVIASDEVSRLEGQIQHYAWGGYHFLPDLLGIQPEAGMTYAEYWMGAHRKAPSTLRRSDGSVLLLDRLIDQQPVLVLGSAVARKYGRLPFLMKVLDVRETLSIQVHPTKAEAEAGFARENALQIPLDAPERNYKDDNHKPELQLALSDFWLLHGFQPEAQLVQVLRSVPELTSLLAYFECGGYRGLYEYVMQLPAADLKELLAPLAERILPLYRSGVLPETSPDYWAARAMSEGEGQQYDRGIFSVYFFNLVKLKPGQAQFQDAGVPHALLRGQTIEIMANSDNVIRGGLTPKTIDVTQLLQLVQFQGISSEIIEGRPGSQAAEVAYDFPSQEFGLSRICLDQDRAYAGRTTATEILLNLQGEVSVQASGQELLLRQGESFVVFAAKNYQLRSHSEQAQLFRAFIPALPALT